MLGGLNAVIAYIIACIRISVIFHMSISTSTVLIRFVMIFDIEFDFLLDTNPSAVLRQRHSTFSYRSCTY